MSDFGGEVMAEVLAERALVRPQIIPLVPLTNQYRHQDHMDLKDYKSKVSPGPRVKHLLHIQSLWVMIRNLYTELKAVYTPIKRFGKNPPFPIHFQLGCYFFAAAGIQIK